ncbi:molybdopterin-dependent oxidoreductase [soil metagenome]
MRRRCDDGPLLTGAARFVADVDLPDALHAVFVRSPLAHARIVGADLHAAGGLAHVFTADDLDLRPLPSDPDVDPRLARPPLGRDVVRFAGEPVAVVVARDPAVAVDAAAACAFEFEPLPAVVDPTVAVTDLAPLVFAELDSNIVREIDTGYDAVDLSAADIVVRARFVHRRVAPLPLDAGGAVAMPDDGGLIVWVGAQEPFRTRAQIAAAVGLDVDRVRLVLPAVGGGFGGKLPTYPEHVVVAALALRLGAPVRYVETRSENLVTMIHGRGQIQDVEVGARRDGTLVGLRARILLDAGAYPRMLDRAGLTTSMLCGAYRIPQAGATVTAVATNAPTVRAYRGVGRVEATALVERSIDLIAAELDLDPLDVRRRNLIPADAYPHHTAAGARYDSGDLPRAVDAATAHIGYHALRRDQRRRRGRGAAPHLGIGIGAYVSVTGWDPEFGAVEITADGRAVVTAGTADTGQGHATAWARLVGDALGIADDHIVVTPLDTDAVPRGGGSWGSRSVQTAGNAVARACSALADRAARIAAGHWGVDVGTVAIGPDGATVADSGAAPLSWARLAALAGDDPLRAAVDHDQEHLTAPSGVHIAVVEVDADTGAVNLIRYVAVDDCGRVLVPEIVDGQIHGGVAQGIGETLSECIRHAADGKPVTTTLRAYKIPGALEVPTIETIRCEVPAPGNPLGVKGVGESGAVGAVAAVRNAVIDAVAHLGVRHIDVPLTPERVWRAVHDG